MDRSRPQNQLTLHTNPSPSHPRSRLALTAAAVLAFVVCGLLFSLPGHLAAGQFDPPWPAFTSFPAAPDTHGTATLTVNPPAGTLTAGQTITVDVLINTSVASREAQFALTFDPTVLKCTKVTEGTFYKNYATAGGNGMFTMLLPTPTCDNINGKVTTIGIAIFGGTGGPSGSGTLASVTFQILGNGISPVTIFNDIVDDDSPNPPVPMALTEVNALVVVGSTPTATFTPTLTPTTPVIYTSTTTLTPTVTTAPTQTPTITCTPTSTNWFNCTLVDFNHDGVVDIRDISIFGSFYGQTGAPGWIPEDVNKDGVVNIADLTLVGSCYGHVIQTATATSTGQAAPPTSTETQTLTAPAAKTATFTQTLAITPTPTITPTATISPTPTQTVQVSNTNTPTITQTPTVTLTGQASLTATATRTITQTSYPTNTPTITPTPSSSIKLTTTNSTLGVGQSFEVDVSMNVAGLSRGAQAGIHFDPAVLRCDSADEGNFYSTWAQNNGATTVLIPQTIPIDNTLGVIGTTGVTIFGGTIGQGATGAGTLFVLHFTTLAQSSSTTLHLVEVVLNNANIPIQVVPVYVGDLQVSVSNSVASATATRTQTQTQTRTQTQFPSITSTPAPFLSATITPTATQTSVVVQTRALTPMTATPIPTLQANASLSLNPAQANINVGDSFTVDVMLSSDKPVRAVSVAMSFNPAVLQIDSISEGTFLKSWATANGGSTIIFASNPKFDNTAGKLNLWGDGIFGAVVGPSNAEGGATGSAPLLTLHMTAKANGVSPLTFTTTQLKSDNIVVPADLQVSVSNGQVFVGVTPTPGGATVAITATTSGTPGTPLPTATGGSGTLQTTGTGTPAVTGSATALPAVVPTTAGAVAVPTTADNSSVTGNLAGLMDQNGILQQNVELRSADGRVALQIAKDVQALTVDNFPLPSIKVEPFDQPPAADSGKNIVPLAYNLSPTDATFDPPITIVFAYDRSKLPKNSSENNLAIAYFDIKTNQWTALKTTVDTKATTLSAKVNHLGLFGILASPRSTNWLLIIVIIIVVCGVAFATFWTFRMRNPPTASTGGASTAGELSLNSGSPAGTPPANDSPSPDSPAGDAGSPPA